MFTIVLFFFSPVFVLGYPFDKNGMLLPMKQDPNYKPKHVGNKPDQRLLVSGSESTFICKNKNQNKCKQITEYVVSLENTFDCKEMTMKIIFEVHLHNETLNTPGYIMPYSKSSLILEKQVLVDKCQFIKRLNHYLYYYGLTCICIYYFLCIFSYDVNDEFELIVLDGRYFKSKRALSDQRISDYLLNNRFITQWLAFKMYFLDEKNGEFINLVAIQV